MTLGELQTALATLDEGVLLPGVHRPDTRQFCALEFSHAVRGHSHSDRPTDLPDIRPLNDGPWLSNSNRTKHMLPVLAAYWDWQSWPPTRQQTVATRIVLLTISRLIAELPGLSEQTRMQCQMATTLLKAQKAIHEVLQETKAAAEAGMSGLRPDTGDGRSLPCVTCGTTTPAASYLR